MNWLERGTAVVSGVAALVAASVACAQEALRYRFQEGEVRRYEVEQTFLQTVRTGNRDFEQTVEQDFQIRMTVANVAQDGAATVQLQFDRARLYIDGPNIEGEYDTAADEQPHILLLEPLSALLDALRAADVRMVIDPRGQVREIAGHEDVVERALAAQQLGFSLTEDTLTYFATGNVVFPEEMAVEEGAAWQQEFVVDVGFGDLVGTASHSISGREEIGGQACVEVHSRNESQLQIDPREPLARFLGGNIDVEVPPGEAERSFDAERGWLVRLHETQPMRLSFMGVTVEFEGEADVRWLEEEAGEGE